MSTAPTVIPKAEQPERELLGAIILSPSAMLPRCSQVTPEHFFNLQHRSIFSAIRSLESDAEPIEALSICRRIEQSGQIADFALVSSLPDSGVADYHRLGYLIGELQWTKTRRDVFALSEAAERETVSVPELIKKLKAIVEEAQAPDLRMQDELAGREYDPAKPPPEQRVVYKMAFVPIATAGNIDCITAQAKYGKTAVINSIIASVLTSLESEADTFTIQSHNPDSKALVHFDTEQCPADHWKQIDRAVARAKAKAKPNWLLSYCLTGMAAHEAWKTVKFGIEQAAKKFGGVHSVLIDGVADLVVDVNDPAECNAFVAELHSIAIRHDCPIICVIHFNPGSEKARGHLGSQLERKAETNLKLEKENETTVVYSAKQRNAPISKETGPRFKWCNEQMMHVSCESAGVQKEDLKRQSAMSEIEDVFNGHPSMRYSDLKSTVKTVLTVTDRTAERRIQQWEHLKLIKKPFGSLYAKAF